MPTPLHPTFKIRTRLVNALQRLPKDSREEGELKFLAWLLEGEGYQWELKDGGRALYKEGLHLLPGGAAENGPPGELLGAAVVSEAQLPKGLLRACFEQLQESRQVHGARPLEAKEHQYGALLQQRWRPDGPGYERPPLMSAVLARDEEEIEELLRHGVSVNMQNPQGDTALHFALWNDRMDEAGLLLDNGANPYISNHKGQTPLHVFGRKIAGRGLQRSQRRVLARIIESFVPVQDAEGNLPHHFLLAQVREEEALEIMTLLLEKTPLTCFAQQNNQGKTPLQMLQSGPGAARLQQAATAYKTRLEQQALEEQVLKPNASPRGRI